jgi:hypothetical protein
MKRSMHSEVATWVVGAQALGEGFFL